MTETIDMTRAVRARNALFAVFAANGFALAYWMARVPDVKDLLQLTPGQLSVLLLSISVGALVGLPRASLRAVVLGGMGTVVGVILGAVILKLLPEKLRFFADYRLLLFGLRAARPAALIPRTDLKTSKRPSGFRQPFRQKSRPGSKPPGRCDPRWR